jgi:hypothetical protein
MVAVWNNLASKLALQVAYKNITKVSLVGLANEGQPCMAG